ncbi:hypothetical protein ACVSQB_17295 [Bradyrhizobium elkanii]
MSVLSQALLMTYVSGGGFTPTTFDPGTLSNASLSNGNLTATRSNTSTGGAQSISYKSAGKHYWEYVVGASHGGTDFVGVMAASYGYFPAINGNTGPGAGVWLGGGQIVNNGGTIGSFGGAVNAPGTVIRNAFDGGNGKFWQAINAGAWENNGTYDPATNTGGRTYPTAAMAPAVAFSPYGSPVAGDNITAKFGGSPFVYTVPTGFIAGWPQ